ncbi:MAG: hypothetical protein ACREV2_20900 [Burkholderiales bacterium]
MIQFLTATWNRWMTQVGNSHASVLASDGRPRAHSRAKGAASRLAAATASWLANAASLCGQTDWRLPSRAELLSLVD